MGGRGRQRCPLADPRHLKAPGRRLMSNRSLRVEILVTVGVSLGSGLAWAQQSSGMPPEKNGSSGGPAAQDLKAPELTLAQNAPASQKAPAGKEPAKKEAPKKEPAKKEPPPKE